MAAPKNIDLLKLAVLELYNTGMLKHQPRIDTEKTIVTTETGAKGVKTGDAYTSGFVKGSKVFVDAAGKFKTDTLVLVGDTFRLTVDEFSIDHIVASVESDTHVTFTKPAPCTVPADKDAGYSVIRHIVDEPFDNIMVLLAAVAADIADLEAAG